MDVTPASLFEPAVELLSAPHNGTRTSKEAARATDREGRAETTRWRCDVIVSCVQIEACGRKCKTFEKRSGT